MIPLKGAQVSLKLKEETKELAASLKNIVPKLAVIRVGERLDDLAYERNAVKKMTDFGMEAEVFSFDEAVSEELFLEQFQKINEMPSVNGILVMNPLPGHLDMKKVESMIRPEKDLDGISPVNVAKVFAGEADGFAPCTAEAVVELLKAYEIPIAGRRAVVVGRSMVVGRPLSMLLLKENATVTICHTKTKELKEVCLEADILVAAAGKAAMLTRDYVKKDSVVIDVGINVDEYGALCGDVLWDGLSERASAATPVPGGVGSVTTAVLAKHLAQAALRQRK